MRTCLYKILGALSVTAALWACGATEDTVYYPRVADGKFIVGEDTEYRFVGTNFWYGPILGSPGEGGDRQRLLGELDFMKSIGVDNLRILVGSEGDAVHSKVVPILQPEPGVYDEDLLEGLDFLLCEMGKREMYAVLFLNNSWEWSGGYCQYLKWAGRGKYPIPNVDGWGAYMEYVKQYHEAPADDPCKTLFEDHVRFIVGRTNKLTGKPYAEDPAIFSWQIANEPRAFSDAGKETFAAWIGDVARLIKLLDPNHMVSTGSEGVAGSENDMDLWERIHSYPEIDYANTHAWPYNWGWIDEQNMGENIGAAKSNLTEYVARHLRQMTAHGKPVVLEEFGFPRDGFCFTPGSPVTLRDEFYGHVFDLLEKDARDGGLFAGCNFWAWGGFGTPSGEHLFWSVGDDYLGDPAQEEQGLNSVFADDTTIGEIRNANLRLNRAVVERDAVPGNGSPAAQSVLLHTVAADGAFLFGQQDFPFYGFTWTAEPGRSDVRDITGDYPALLGVDLGEIELGGAENLDGVPFAVIKEQIVAHHLRGGLTTVSWHPRNPLTGGDAWDVTSAEVVRSVLPGGSQHEKFTGWLDTVAAFLCSLEAEGRRVPVIFRPWHEHTGSWFWWGHNLCTADEYKALWKMTVVRLQEKGAGDMLLAYSPSPTGDAARYLERYPGDGWVDILGTDAYHGGGEAGGAGFKERLSGELAMISGLAADRGKLVALTETGCEALEVPDWYTGVLLPALEGKPVSYVLVWRNANRDTKENHFYAPYPGHRSEDNFREFYGSRRTVFADGPAQYKK